MSNGLVSGTGARRDEKGHAKEAIVTKGNPLEHLVAGQQNKEQGRGRQILQSTQGRAELLPQSSG